MQTVIETKAFLAAAKGAGMSDEEREALITTIAKNPIAGDLMQGTGGCRKLRHKRRGKGKSGSYRAITWFDGADIPIFLITVFGKNEKANLTKSERNALSKMTGQLRETLRKK